MRALSSALLTPLLALFVLGAAAGAEAATLNVPLDHSVRLPLSGSAASVIIGNPKVADVSVVDSHTVFISGRDLGLTDVIVVDQLGRTVYAADVSVTTPGAGVAVFRGSGRSDLACSPRCAASTRSSAPASTIMAPTGASSDTPAPTPMGAGGAGMPMQSVKN